MRLAPVSFLYGSNIQESGRNTTTIVQINDLISLFVDLLVVEGLLGEVIKEMLF